MSRLSFFKFGLRLSEGLSKFAFDSLTFSQCALKTKTKEEVSEEYQAAVSLAMNLRAASGPSADHLLFTHQWKVAVT